MESMLERILDRVFGRRLRVANGQTLVVLEDYQAAVKALHQAETSLLQASGMLYSQGRRIQDYDYQLVEMGLRSLADGLKILRGF